MAKTKKSESSVTPAPKKAPAKKPAAAKPVAAKAAAAKPAATKASKSNKPAVTPQSPLIDTGLAAQSAAAMVANRGAAGRAGAAGQGSGQPAESSSFKNFKDSLNKPSGGSLGSFIGSGGGNKKFAQQTGGPKQMGGRNQTFGADVNRTGVPRRTGG